MLHPNYIVGLVDGAGNFTAYVRSPDDSKEVKRKVKVELRFSLKVVETDSDILYKLKNFFGCGNVYFQKDNRKNHQAFFRYEVAHRDDLEKTIIPFFLRHPLHVPSQKKDFMLFSEIVRRIKQGEHLTNHGLGILHFIKRQMH